jgi:hypothetical protein
MRIVSDGLGYYPEFIFMAPLGDDLSARDTAGCIAVTWASRIG